MSSELNSFRVLSAGDVLAETPGRHPDAPWLASGTQGGDTMSEEHALSGSMRCPGSVAALPCSRLTFSCCNLVDLHLLRAPSDVLPWVLARTRAFLNFSQGSSSLFSCPPHQLWLLNPAHPTCLQLLETRHSSWGSDLLPKIPQHGALFLA